MLMFCVILLSDKEICEQPVTVGLVWSFVAAAVPVAFGLFYASRALVTNKDLDDALKTKLDSSKFDSFKEDVFENFQKEVFDKIEEHKTIDELKYKMFADNMKEVKRYQEQSLNTLKVLCEKMAIVETNTKWLEKFKD